MVARLVWDQDAAGSTPVTSTISGVHNECEYLISFFIINLITNMYWSSFLATPFFSLRRLLYSLRKHLDECLNCKIFQRYILGCQLLRRIYNV